MLLAEFIFIKISQIYLSRDKMNAYKYIILIWIQIYMLYVYIHTHTYI